MPRKSASLGASAIPTTSSLGKARRIARAAKTYTPCVSCIAYMKACNDFRPCSRCTKAGKECVRAYQPSSSALDQDTMRIERPLCVASVLTKVRGASISSTFHALMDWARSPLFLSAAQGHDVQSYADAGLMCIPYQYHAELNDAMKRAQALAPRAPPPPAAHTSAPTLPALADEAISDTDPEAGHVTTAFDPASNELVRLTATLRHAALFGYHRQEFLARAAAQELPLPFAEVGRRGARDFPSAGSGSDRGMFSRLRIRESMRSFTSVGSGRAWIAAVRSIIAHISPPAEVRTSPA